jgi:hypothetical protein
LQRKPELLRLRLYFSLPAEVVSVDNPMGQAMNINWEKVRVDSIVTRDRYIPHQPLGSDLWCICDAHLNQVVVENLSFDAALLQAQELSDKDKAQ